MKAQIPSLHPLLLAAIDDYLAKPDWEHLKVWCEMVLKVCGYDGYGCKGIACHNCVMQAFGASLLSNCLMAAMFGMACTFNNARFSTLTDEASQRYISTVLDLCIRVKAQL